MKRSNKPIFWSLFGAGGTFSALIGPMLIFITGIGIPFGIGFSREALSYPRALAFAQHTCGMLTLLAVISLFLFHGCHRLYHSLHDFGIHVGPGIKAAFHGFAALGTLAAVVLLVRIGSSA